MKHGHSARQTPRGKRPTPEYRAWQEMKRRCLAAHRPKFDMYGGRGIAVCARWLDSFEDFLADMGPRPSTRHSLERKNNDGDYTPDNCKWATRKEQIENRRCSRKLTVGSRTLSLDAWSKETGTSYSTIHSRLKRGWPPEEALRPRTLRLRGVKELTFSGRTLSVADWAKVLGFPKTKIYKRLAAGWSVEETLSHTPKTRRRRDLKSGRFLPLS